MLTRAARIGRRYLYMSEIAKVYNPSEIEPRWAREWVEKRLFAPSADSVSGTLLDTGPAST